MSLPAHCESCARYPQAYHLGYADVLEGPIDDVGNTPDVPEGEEECNWWLAYWHGSRAARQEP